MEKLFMSAGVVTAIVLCIIGLLKLPFNGLKGKHPVLYKAIFTFLSIVISIGLCVLNEWYILYGKLLSFDFLILICVVLAGVFCGYNGVYEGFGVKELVKKLFDNIKKAKHMIKDKKILKYLNKVEDIDKVIVLLEELKNQKNNEV